MGRSGTGPDMAVRNHRQHSMPSDVITNQITHSRLGYRVLLRYTESFLGSSPSIAPRHPADSSTKRIYQVASNKEQIKIECEKVFVVPLQVSLSFTQKKNSSSTRESPFYYQITQVSLSL